MFHDFRPSSYSVADPERFDAHPDPTGTFYCILMLIRIPLFVFTWIWIRISLTVVRKTFIKQIEIRIFFLLISLFL